MSKIYVVRELIFRYNDEVYYTGLPAGIDSIFNTEAEARKRCNDLEVKRMREFNLFEYDEVRKANQETLIKLENYLEPLITESLIEYNEEYEQYRIKPWRRLPDSLTDEQILKIIEMLDIQYYVINVFEKSNAKTAYFIFWIPRLGQPLQAKVDLTTTGAGIKVSPYFFASKQEALDAIGEELLIHFRRVPLDESIDDLSEQPALLRSFIQAKSESFQVKDNHLKINFYAKGEDIIGLNALLKVPLFELRPITLDEAIEIPSGPFHAP